MATYRRDVRKQILRLRAVNVLVRPRVSVTDADVKEKYDRDARKAGAVTEVSLAHILIVLPESPSADEKAAARRRAGELVERARGGEDFAQLALASSEDGGTKDKGGELGSFKRGELPTEWEEQLFTAESGEIRGPIEGPRGLHVFKVLGVKKDAVKAFDEVKDKYRNELYADEMEKQTKIWLEELRRRTHVEIKL
jgi:parvulin-like peptidyl-prolyl isomerase